MFERLGPYVPRTVPLLAIPTSAAVLAAGLAAIAPAQASSPAEPASLAASAAPGITPKVRELPVPAAKQQRPMRMHSAPEGGAQAERGREHKPEQGRVVAATGMRPTKPYSMVGVTWAAAEGAEEFQAEVRVRDEDGWTDWQHLHTHSDGPTGDDTAGTAPLWVGEAEGVQVRVLSSSSAVPRDVEVSLIDPGEAPGEDVEAASALSLPSAAGTTAVEPASHVDEPKPSIISRRGWGADESLTEPCSHGLYTRTTDVAFVHHTAGSNNYAKSESKSIVRGIYAYHTKSRGWCDIGYNFLVDKYGQIFEGRRGGVWKPVYGAHTGGYNNNSIGVSLMGNFESARPSRAMKNATTRIVAWKLATNYRHPKGSWRINGKKFRNISGHRDAKSTACPGRHVYNWLPTLRNRVDNRIAPFNSAIFKKWRNMGGRNGIARVPFRGEQHRSGGVVAQFRGADLLYKSGTGTHEVHGAIRHRYRKLGSQKHTLGFPTSDETAGGSGSRKNHFQRGRIYFSKGTGAREVYGRIMKRYKQMRAERGRLGLPTTGEINAAVPGSRQNRFQGGRIYWSRRTGAHEVYGDILKRYSKLGAASGRLGLPTTGERSAPGGRMNKFQGGEIRWNRSTRKTTVRYY